MYKPRPKQLEVLSYEGGRMGVAAVPGSGKTWTLSYLAAKLVASGLEEDQEVLIVTLVNSAVENFAHRIALFLKEEMGLLPGLGYRVRTLHGLSNDIVREWVIGCVPCMVSPMISSGRGLGWWGSPRTLASWMSANQMPSLMMRHRPG